VPDNQLAIARFLCMFAAMFAATSATSHAETLHRIGRVSIPGAETVAYEHSTNIMFVSSPSGISMVHLGGGDAPTVIRKIRVDEFSGLPPGCRGESSHVAVDPAGRGFVAVTVMPMARASLPGRVVFLSTRTGKPLASVWVGFGPDACAFSQDGSRLVVANEGEPAMDPVSRGVVDPPGSVSVIDLSGVTNDRDICSLTQSAVATIWFTGDAVDHARSLRIHPSRLPAFDLEPEYVAIHDDLAFVSLQENNGIAALDLNSLRWRRVEGLGSMVRVLDASSQDGTKVETSMNALPMPDQIAVLATGGRLVLLTANEGDVRAELGKGPATLVDHGRLADLVAANLLDQNAVASIQLMEQGVGRMFVCSFSGDDDSDGQIERPMALGARSMSAWDASTFELLADTGSEFEQRVGAEMPELYNDSGKKRSDRDATSTCSGPEPEGICTGVLGGRSFAFVTLERPGAIAVVDVTQPESVEVVDLHPAAREDDRRPEGLAFVTAEESPTGVPLLLVAYEESGSLSVYTVNR